MAKTVFWEILHFWEQFTKYNYFQIHTHDSMRNVKNLMLDILELINCFICKQLKKTLLLITPYKLIDYFFDILLFWTQFLDAINPHPMPLKTSSAQQLYKSGKFDRAATKSGSRWNPRRVEIYGQSPGHPAASRSPGCRAPSTRVCG